MILHFLLPKIGEYMMTRVRKVKKIGRIKEIKRIKGVRGVKKAIAEIK